MNVVPSRTSYSNTVNRIGVELEQVVGTVFYLEPVKQIAFKKISVLNLTGPMMEITATGAIWERLKECTFEII